METKEALQRLYSSFDVEAMEKRAQKAMQERLASQPVQPAPPAPPEPIDIYQRNRSTIQDVAAKSFPKGSSAIVNTSVEAVLDGMGAEGLIRAFKRAQSDANALKERGERGRAEIRRKQYMEENFLPAVEIVVNSTSPDEVLANADALKELDKYVLLEGPGKGYTASYIRQAYGNQLGQVEGRSDDAVRSGVMRLNSLLDAGELRTAFGVASKLKKQIDRGEHISDDIDYEMIGRVVAYFS